MAVSPETGVAGAGRPGAGRGGEDGDEDAGPGLMDRAALKAMLTLAKGKPVGCAIALTRDKQPLLLLHRTMRPRQVLAQLRKQATDGGITLDATTLRFGRATVDGASDGQQLGIAVNKAVPNEDAYARKLRGLVKAVGCRRCSLSVDESLDADGAEGDGAGETAGPGPAAAGAALGGGSTSPVASGQNGVGADQGAPGTADSAAAPPGVSPGVSASPAAPAVSRTPLAGVVPPDLARDVQAALSADPSRKPALAQLLAQVRAGVDGGDPRVAEAGITALRQAVNAPAVLPAKEKDKTVGGQAAGQPLPSPPATAPAPSSLQASAGLSSLARAWDAEQARTKQEVGQNGAAPDAASLAADQPSPAPALPTSSAAQRAPDPAQVRADVAAMMRGMDRGRAEGMRGGVQVAQANLPGAATATDADGPGLAERDRMTHWGSLPRPGSQPFPGAVRPAPDWRPLQGLGQVALGAGGFAVSGVLLAAGAGETGLGVVTTPAGGVGIPVAAVGVATMGLGAAVGGGSAVMANKGIDNILAPFRDPRPLPPGMPPGVLAAQDPAAAVEAARRWLADNPAPGAAGSPAPAAPVPDLSGAPVRLGPMALSTTPPDLAGVLGGDGGYTPARPMAPLPGYTPAPPVPALPGYTPTPDGQRPPTHTGNTDEPRVDLGNWQEGFTAAEPQGLDIFEKSRNEGLSGFPKLKTYTSRARENARQADPAAAALLPDKDWQAQHNIPVEVVKDNLDLFGPASKAQNPFKTDGVDNVAVVPNSPEAQAELAKNGISAPVHNGSHPAWTNLARIEVDQIKRQLARERLRPKMAQYGERAAELLRQSDARLRQALAQLREVK